MARKVATLAYECLSVEGGLFPAEWFTRLAQSGLPDMAAEDYRLPAGLQLRDEISRAWTIARTWWQRYGKSREGHAAESIHAVRAATAFTQGLLREVLGFQSLEVPSAPYVLDGRSFPLSLTALGGRMPVVVAGWGEMLDAPLDRLKDGRRRSPFGLLQDYLNAADVTLWGLVTNGRTLRLLRDNAALTRPAWVEVDLERLFTGDHHADFAALWLLLHETRFGLPGAALNDSWIEQQRAAALQDGTRAREKLSTGVAQALRDLGAGFLLHPDNHALREALHAGKLTPQDYYTELLRLVYRLIFIVTVEERGLLHPPGTEGSAARRRYAEGYAILPLRERAARTFQNNGHHDLWLRVLVVVKGLTRGQASLALPAFGGLFEPDQCPHLDGASLNNASLLSALRALTWVPAGQGLSRVNWRDMGSEELGSIYESLLELVPEIRLGEPQPFRFLDDQDLGTDGNARKRSGSYYTPDSLVQCLLDSALEPVIAQRVLSLASDPERASAELLSLSVIDPACGSGHFLLGAARRLAGHLARLHTDGTPSAAEYRSALRQVVTHCIYGTDKNALAIELARMALWLEATTPEAPLGFLDHHLRHGDALLGLLDLGVLSEGIPDEAYETLAGDNAAAAKALKQRNRRERSSLEAQRAGGPQLALLPAAPLETEAWAQLEIMPDDTPARLEAKRFRATELAHHASGSGVMLAANLYMAAFLLPKKAAGDSVPTTQHILAALQGQVVPDAIKRATAGIVSVEHFNHWKLTFPQVFSRGGFDLVIGNPPWEQMQLSEEEFFSSREPDIARLPGRRRKDAIRQLEDENPRLFFEYQHAAHGYEAANSFARAGGRYPLTARGKVNLYPLFAETMMRLSSRAGRAGMIVPSGIATDSSTAPFFRFLTEEHRLVMMIGFDNQRKIFPSVHPDTPFSLLTLAREATAATVCQYILDTTDLPDRRRWFTLTPEELSLLNPNTLTCPIFRSERDAEIAKRIYSKVPVLIDERKPGSAGNPWEVSFLQGLFNMTTDSGLFHSSQAQDRLPLFEAKMIHQFDHRWATYVGSSRGKAEPETVDVTLAQKQDPGFEVAPRYWVERSDIEARLQSKGWKQGWLMGWRDITNATNERTLIASVMPVAGVGNNLPLMFFDAHSLPKAGAILGCLSSLAIDFITRHKVGGTHLNYFIYKQLPVLPPAAFAAGDLALIMPKVAELTCTTHAMKPWAATLGWNAQPTFDPNRRALLRAELDAWYAHLYGLTRDELRYVLDPADALGPDYPSETFRVLKKNEIAEFGEYRTARLVLDAWDRLVEPARRAGGRP